MLIRRPIVVALVAVLTITACTSAQPTGSPSGTVAGSPTDGQTSPPTDPAGRTPTPGLTPDVPEISEACRAENIEGLKNPPRLTLSTDIPAFPPWWGGDPGTQYPTEPAEGSGWEVSDPYSMEGYESATAYAVAAALGFTADEVDWIQNTVFARAFRPGPKDFDFHLAQISIRRRRARNVDFSQPYFDANQSILTLPGNPITDVTTIEGLKDFRLGAAVNTTSFELIESVIVPNEDPSVYDDNAAALAALRADQIDGLVVDLQTAFFMRDAQLEGDGVVVGQFSVSAQADQMGIILEKGSPLTGCVNEALAQIEANGTRQSIYDQWISTEQDIPTFE